MEKEVYCKSCVRNTTCLDKCSGYENGIPNEIRRGDVSCNFYKVKRTLELSGLIGLTVGDALGVPVEFTPRNLLDIIPVTSMIGEGAHMQPEGTWSDDTSLAIASIKGLEKGIININKIGKEFLNWYEMGYYTPHGKVFDIGRATQYSILRIKNGVHPSKSGEDHEGSNGNGSLMRMLPIAYFLNQIPGLDKRRIATFLVSGITHNHIRSKIACHIYVELAIKLLQGKTLEEAYEYITKDLYNYYKEGLGETKQPKFLKMFSKPKEFKLTKTEEKEFERVFSGEIRFVKREEIKSGGYVIDSLESAIWCLFNTDSYRDCVLTAVNLGGDTDTTAAITGGLAGILYGYDNIPTEWVNSLQNRIIVNNAAWDLHKKCEILCS